MSEEQHSTTVRTLDGRNGFFDLCSPVLFQLPILFKIQSSYLKL